jgi:hypothetical protein
MKLSHIFLLVVGSAAASILASTSPAHALDFNFTFTTDQGSIQPITVTGSIYGLVDNSTSSATSVVVTSVSDNNFAAVLGFNLLNVENQIHNSFTVTNGAITNASYYAYGLQNPSTYPYIGLLLGTQPGFGGNYNYLDVITSASSQQLSSYNLEGFGGATYSSASASVPFDIPGGATIPSVGALLALGAMRKARKSIASKTRLANPVCASVS